jgi:hypothetical protein
MKNYDANRDKEARAKQALINYYKRKEENYF